MIVKPFISWSHLAAIAILPSACTLVAAHAFPLSDLTSRSVAAGALTALPINLLAIALSALALGLAVTNGLGPVLAFAGVAAGLLVRVAGTVISAFAIHLLHPELLTSALATLCALLLVALGCESLLYARRLLAPSVSESARA